VKEGDIVIALTRTTISAGLKVAVVPSTYDGALVNQRVAALVDS
jgi:type I restriction enzyme S subunit